MANRFLTVGAISAALAFAPAVVQAQAETNTDSAAQADAAAAGAPAEGPEAAAQAEGPTVAEVAAQIQRVQQQALQDPALKAASQQISMLIAQTLPKVDPNYPAYAARAATLKTDVAAAQAAQDNARLNDLAEEAKQLQANVAAAQARAREDAAVKAKLDDYKVKLFTKMVEIDPAVQELVAQLEELQKGQ